MGDNELAALEARLRSIDAKLDRIEIRMESFATANGRHSERLRHVEDGLQLCHERVSGVKKQEADAVKRFIGILLGFCGATLAVIWSWIKAEIGK